MDILFLINDLSNYNKDLIRLRSESLCNSFIIIIDKVLTEPGYQLMDND